jgi:hypothetical protein
MEPNAPKVSLRHGPAEAGIAIKADFDLRARPGSASSGLYVA